MRKTRQQQVSKARIKQSPFRSAVRESPGAGLDTAGRSVPSSSSGAPLCRGSSPGRPPRVRSKSSKLGLSRGSKPGSTRHLLPRRPRPLTNGPGAGARGRLLGPGERPSFFHAVAPSERRCWARGVGRACAREGAAHAWRWDIAGIAVSSLLADRADSRASSPAIIVATKSRQRGFSL